MFLKLTDKFKKTEIWVNAEEIAAVYAAKIVDNEHSCSETVVHFTRVVLKSSDWSFDVEESIDSIIHSNG